MQPDVPAQGTVLWIRQQRWRVERARREKNIVRLDLAGAGGRLTFLAPFDRPQILSSSDRPRRVRPQSLIARLAGLLGREELHARALPAAAGAAIQVLPYQLEPALALLGSSRRALIADAVGLGKTIQAGVVIAELRRCYPSIRALVAVPSALRRQWSDELRAHFGIEALCADAAALDELARFQSRTSAPWDRAGVWIGSIDYLKQPHVLRGAVQHVWDLLVIDEAHGVCGHTERHAAADALGRCARRIVLLSATPHSGVDAQFERLLAIGALPGVKDDDVVVFRRTRADLGMAADRRTRYRAVRLSIEETRLLDALAAFERVVVARGRSGEGLLLLSVFRKRALSTISACQRSIERRLSFIETGADGWLQGRLFFDDDEDDVSGDDRAALSADIGLDESVERSWLRRLRELAVAGSRRESKMHRVLTFVRRSREPVAIFTEFRDSLTTLLPHIETIRHAAFLHGGLSADDQQRQLDRFLSGEASVLVSTDVASQGLNLQSRCRCVLSLELPWNASRLEQRAGRVDRIGQHRRVHAGVFVAQHDADANLLDRLASRARAAHQAAASSTRWSRPARVIARRLQRQRTLAARWRGPVTPRRPCTATARWSPHLCPGGDGAFLLLCVPIVDRAGDLVERRFVCVGIPADAVCGASVIDAARALAGQHLAPRVRRLCRLRQRNAARHTELERAIAHSMTSRCSSSELQPGLFDRRALAAASVGTARAAEILRVLQGRLDALEAEAVVVAGAPVVVATWSRSR